MKCYSSITFRLISSSGGLVTPVYLEVYLHIPIPQCNTEGRNPCMFLKFGKLTLGLG